MRSRPPAASVACGDRGDRALVEARSTARFPGVVGAGALDIGSPRAPLRERLLRHERAGVRTGAAELLGYVGDAGDATPFVDVAGDPVRRRSRARLAALGGVGDARDAARFDSARRPTTRCALRPPAALGSIGEGGSSTSCSSSPAGRVRARSRRCRGRIAPRPRAVRAAAMPRTPASTSGGGRPGGALSCSSDARRRAGGRHLRLLRLVHRRPARVHRRRVGELAASKRARATSARRGLRVAADARRLGRSFPRSTSRPESSRACARCSRCATRAGGRRRERRVDGRDPGAAPRSVRPRRRWAGAARARIATERDPGATSRAGTPISSSSTRRTAASRTRSTPGIGVGPPPVRLRDRRRRGPGRGRAAGGRASRSSTIRSARRRGGRDRPRRERVHDRPRPRRRRPAAEQPAARRFQVLEYVRAFLVGRVGWSRLNALLIVSGAFGLFRREQSRPSAAMDATPSARTSSSSRLHRYLRERGEPYRIAFVARPGLLDRGAGDASHALGANAAAGSEAGGRRSVAPPA